MTGSAKQSFSRHNGWVDCFAVLAMTAEGIQYKSVHWNTRPITKVSLARKNFFSIFVDGMFTTFIARLFTNASDALNEIRAMSCVLHVGHAD